MASVNNMKETEASDVDWKVPEGFILTLEKGLMVSRVVCINLRVFGAIIKHFYYQLLFLP